MNAYQGAERRATGVGDTALLIDIAINYRRTIGSQCALDYLAAKGVPGQLAARIFCAPDKRRLTTWERMPNEAGLRRALCARPLLDDAPAEQRRA